MCGRISQPPKAMLGEFSSRLGPIHDYNVNLDTLHVPSQSVYGRDPVIVIAQSKLPQMPGLLLVQTSWGVQLGEHNVYNARIETAHAKPAWANAFQFHRVLIPVLSFYELNQGTRRVFECFKQDDEVFMLGGIGVKVEGSGMRNLVLCTRDSTPEVGVVHRRMPVIVPPHLQQEWLTNNLNPVSIVEKLIRRNFPIQLREAA